jgi:hypothetical protein
MADMDDDDEFSGDFGEENIEDAIAELGQWLEDAYTGDDRFEYVELATPGPGENETFRLRLVIDDSTEFFVALLREDNLIRVGLSTEDAAVNDSIEEAMLEGGGTLTEFLAEAMEAEEELEREVQHLNEDYFYFCSEITYESAVEVNSETQRDEIVYYLDGYITALIELAQEAG